MEFFRYFTPVSYWTLILLWSIILVFYLHRIIFRKIKNDFLAILLVILAIDAFRTLFESIYFGAWYTSLAGFLPIYIHDFLVQPELVFIPKFLNVIVALLIICIIIRYWLPREKAERSKHAKDPSKQQSKK